MNPNDPHITVTYRRLALPSQRWRWNIKSPNGRKLANGGEGYTELRGLANALKALWPSAPSQIMMMISYPIPGHTGRGNENHTTSLFNFIQLHGGK